MPWAIVAGVGALSGIGNYLAQKDANDRAAMIQNQMFQNWMNLNIPDPAEQKVALQQFVSKGTLTPAMQSAIAQAPSEFNKIVKNADTEAAQNRALSELSNIGYSGGLRLQDKAALQDATLRSQAQARAGRQGIVDEMARRGLSGSGYDVAAQLQGQQGDADRQAQASLQTAANAQDRSLKAIMGAGDLANKMSQQDFEQQAAKASAQDRINAFNTTNLRDVNAANTNATNASNYYNLNNAQRIADQNTQLNNAQTMYNKGLIQQQYQNEMSRLAGATGESQALAGTTQRQGQLLGNTISNIGGSAANYALLNSYFGNGKSGGNSASGSGYGDASGLSSNNQAAIDRIRSQEDEDPTYYAYND